MVLRFTVRGETDERSMWSKEKSNIRGGREKRVTETPPLYKREGNKKNLWEIQSE